MTAQGEWIVKGGNCVAMITPTGAHVHIAIFDNAVDAAEAVRCVNIERENTVCRYCVVDGVRRHEHSPHGACAPGLFR